MVYSDWVIGGEFNKGTFHRGDSRVQEVHKGKHKALGVTTVTTITQLSPQLERPKGRSSIRIQRGQQYGEGCLTGAGALAFMGGGQPTHQGEGGQGINSDPSVSTLLSLLMPLPDLGVVSPLTDFTWILLTLLGGYLICMVTLSRDEGHVSKGNTHGYTNA